MAIRNLGDKISKSDMETVRNLRNPPEYEPGYEGTQGGQSNQGVVYLRHLSRSYL